MLPYKGAGLGQGFDIAIHVDVAVGQLARTLARIHEQGAQTTVDVDPRVALRRARGIREVVKLVLVVAQALGERLEQTSSLVEREFAQVRTANLSRMFEHGAVVEAFGRRVGYHGPRRRITECYEVTGTSVPLAGCEAL